MTGPGAGYVYRRRGRPSVCNLAVLPDNVHQALRGGCAVDRADAIRVPSAQKG
jgi:hypothetical protein